MTTAREIMTNDVRCVQEDQSLAEAARLLRDLNVGAVPICGNDNRLKGMVTDRDIVVKALASGRSPEQTAVREVMTTDLVTCREDEEVTSAVSRMAERQVRRIPVVDRGGSLTGIIAQADVATRVHKDKTTGELVEAISEPEASRR